MNVMTLRLSFIVCAIILSVLLVLAVVNGYIGAWRPTDRVNLHDMETFRKPSAQADSHVDLTHKDITQALKDSGLISETDNTTFKTLKSQMQDFSHKGTIQHPTDGGLISKAIRATTPKHRFILHRTLKHQAPDLFVIHTNNETAVDYLLPVSKDNHKHHPVNTTMEVFVREMQMLNLDAFDKVLRGCNQILLLGIESHENKGDQLIHAAEVIVLNALGKQIIYYCDKHQCNRSAYKQAMELARRYSHVCVLFAGGGNFLSYRSADVVRIEGMSYFKGLKMVVAPQSIWPRHPEPELTKKKEAYRSVSNLTIMVRENKSLKYGKSLFPKAKFVLTPDTGFQYGLVQRSMPPLYDILWHRRDDSESTGYKIPPFPANVTWIADDWRNFMSPKGATQIETLFLHSETGFMFLQRGRVVITDRLHGHIMSTLLGIPHVLLDNLDHKVRSFYNTWSYQLEDVKLVNTPEDAAIEAMLLLEKYNDILPPSIKLM